MKINIMKAMALAPDDVAWMAASYPAELQSIIERTTVDKDSFDTDTQMYEYTFRHTGETITKNLDAFGDTYGDIMSNKPIAPEDVFRRMICFINSSLDEVERWAVPELFE